MKPIQFRKAEIHDSDLLLQWKNDPLTRQASIDSGEVSPETHEKWLLKSLNHPERILLIGELDGQAIGTVRFDLLKTGDWELSWTMAPNHRGRGLGKELVRAATLWKSGPLVAKTRKENGKSGRIAEYAGFRIQKETDDLIFWELRR